VAHHTAPILALDVPRTGDALDLLDRVGDSVGFVKVGLELYLAEGPPVVREMRSRGLQVFLDLKLHDIPNTVGRAVRAVGDLGVDLLTVHSAGGGAMLDAAAEAGRAAGVRIVAVTVLTSLDASGLEAVHGHGVDPAEEAIRLASFARRHGCAGIVCAVGEVAAARAATDEGLVTVTPGIRLPGDAAGDQRRVATPADALRAGADYLVIGRSVTAAADPEAAFRRVLEGLESQPAEASLS
jgi:orotidine-5'-phosphate decarboxylase